MTNSKIEGVEFQIQRGDRKRNWEWEILIEREKCIPRLARRNDEMPGGAECQRGIYRGATAGEGESTGVNCRKN